MKPYIKKLGFSLVLLLSALSLAAILGLDVRAAVDIDTSGGGQAAASDGQESIATDGDSFCSITNDIANGRFSSLFEGIVGDDCNTDSQSFNQFLVDYSYTSNPVRIGEKTYLTVTVKDRSTGDPVSDALVSLNVEPRSSAIFGFNVGGAAATAAAPGTDFTSNYRLDNGGEIQFMATDDNGQATFTVQMGPKSDIGVYDTEIEVSKDNYQSSYEQVDLRVV